MLDIVVMDHMIITTETYYSFADEGEIKLRNRNGNQSNAIEKGQTF